MRFTLTLTNNKLHIDLPIHHNALLQAVIYHNLSSELAEFLHNQGFSVDNRSFRMFVFSRIIGEFTVLKEEQKIRFRSPIKLVISSPIPEFIRDISQIILKDGFRIGNQILEVQALDVDIPLVDKGEIFIQTLSPIVAYSTMIRPDGRKYTAYFEPREEDFSSNVIQNLKRKAMLLHGEKASAMHITIKPIGKHKQHIMKYIKDGHETIIKGYSGRFILKGSQPLLQTAIDVGLGSKNASGFGLVEMVQRMNAVERK